jgi:alkyldihydroxyacetonephosphate synthase
VSEPGKSRRRKFWGWGWQDEGADAAQLSALEAGVKALLEIGDLKPLAAPEPEQIVLRAPRVTAPATLATKLSIDHYERLAHCYGKSYRDVVRALRRDFANPPDLVAFPESAADIAAIFDFCADANLAVIPYGGGSSVCGGVEPEIGESYAGSVSLDLGRMQRVLEIDPISRAARIQAGTFGPALEEQLRPHGLSLRHFPQSFEFSTLGGWIATRSGGHFATLYTHIDELVEALTVVTPRGVIETRRLPGDGAGPSAERLFIGSEGALGVIVEAWMRVFGRPTYRASASARYASFADGARALRAIAQSGLHPSNCRLLDPMEAMLNGAGGGDHAVLLIGFESDDHPLDAWLGRALELCRDHGGEVPETSIRSHADQQGARDGAAGAWRSAFLRAPYLRDALVARGIFVETFETACTWNRFAELHGAVTLAATRAARDSGAGKCVVTCRVTHAYADGAAPYFTVICRARDGDELTQWTQIKSAVTLAMLEAGGTVTHHHAVGRDLRPYYERQRPDGFALALSAAKAALDPAGILNPGVLLAPRARVSTPC